MGLPALASDRLLRALLESAPVRDAELERFLTGVRAGLLQTGDAGRLASAVDEHLLDFSCALARQCFINEYVFAETETEAAQATALRDRLDAGAGERRAGLSALPLPYAAAIAPLHALAQADAFLQRSWPARARRACSSSRCGSPRPSATSAPRSRRSPRSRTRFRSRSATSTRQMPYPRWVKTASVGRPTAIDWYLRGQLPTAPIRPYQTGAGLDVLIAGCGTGQHAIETAQRFAGARVLAIDLSRTSLGYAIRKTREAGLRNIQYAQADILKLGSLDASFDVIEASGVLHHLGDPAQGWRVLLSLLRPGGFMHVGLYSALARADIRAARALIAERGYRRHRGRHPPLPAGSARPAGRHRRSRT